MYQQDDTYQTLSHHDKYMAERFRRMRQVELQKIHDNREIAHQEAEEQREEYSLWSDDSWWNARRDTSNRIGTTLYRSTQNSGIPGIDYVMFYGGKLAYYSIVLYIMLIIWFIKIGISISAYALYLLFLCIENSITHYTRRRGEIPIYSASKGSRIDINPR